MSPLYALFERGVIKRRRSNRIASGVMFVIAIVAVVWGFSNTRDPAMARMAALGSVMLVVCPLIFGLTFLKARGLEALQTPERIVWFYSVGRGPHITGVMIGTEAGKLHKLVMPSLDEAKEALALLRAAAPTATEGFSEARRVQFRQQPQALRTSAATS